MTKPKKKKRAAQKRCKANRNRIFVHPQGDVLQCEQGVFAPGQYVPVEDLPAQMVGDWFQEGLLVEEQMYRMYHGADWNARHPTDQIKPGQGGVDIITKRTAPVTGDEITDPKGTAPTIGGDAPADLED